MALTDTIEPADLAANVDALTALVWQPAIPPAWAVPLAAGTLHDAAHHAEMCGCGAPGGCDQKIDRLSCTCSRCRGDLAAPEGPSWFVTVAPGLVQVGRVDLAKQYRREEKALIARRMRTELAAGWQHTQTELDAVEALWCAETLSIESFSAAWPYIDWANDGGRYLRSVDPLHRFPSRARISEWSAKSRVNMRKRLSTLDYGELLGQGVPAMVTVTLPCADVDCGRCRPGGDRHAPCTGWAAFAANGQAFKALIRKFVKRFERAWSRRLRALWKLEFQSRGAPHMHLLMVPPQGEVDGLRWRDWFARAWADCLDVQGETRAAVIAVHSHRKASADYAEGMRASDPKRIAVYFAKHGVLADKEYQHIVPGEWQGEGDGPGRFWGYWGLARADVAVPVTDAEALAISRTLRRWQASKGVRYTRPVVRLDTRTGTIRARNVVRRYRGMPDSAGFLIVNDGPGVALMLAELLRRRT